MPKRAAIYLRSPAQLQSPSAVTGLTMPSFGLVSTLMIALDHPFRGALSVDDDAFQGVREVARHTFEPLEETK